MKRHGLSTLLLLSSLTLATTAHAQQKAACSPNVVVKILDRIFWGTFDEGLGEAIIAVPAKFPNPASTKTINKPFLMACPNFSIRTDANSIKVTGGIHHIKKLIGYWPEGDPDLTSAVRGRILLAHEGRFRYPSIREEWSSERIYMDFVGGKLRVEAEDYIDPFLKNQVIGARVNGGKLLPVYFDGVVTQIPHGSRDRVEIYLKGEEVQMDYIDINFKAGTITIRNGVPFPKK